MYRQTVIVAVAFLVSLTFSLPNDKHHSRHHHHLKHAAHHNSRQNLHHRDNSDPHLPQPLEIFYVEASQLLAVLNRSANTFSIFDTRSNLALIQINKNITYLADTANNSVQQLNKTFGNVEDVIKNFPQLQQLANQTSNGPQNANEILNEVLSRLNANNSTAGPEIFRQISQLLNRLNSLNIIALLFRGVNLQNPAQLPDGLENFPNITNGCLQLYGPNASQLLQQNPINIASVLNSQNGLERFVKIIQGLIRQRNNDTSSNDSSGNTTDESHNNSQNAIVPPYLGGLLNNNRRVLNIIVEISGRRVGSFVYSSLRIASGFYDLVSGKSGSFENIAKAMTEFPQTLSKTEIGNFKLIVEQVSQIRNSTGMLGNLEIILKQIESALDQMNGNRLNVIKLLQSLASGNGNFLGTIQSLISQAQNSNTFQQLYVPQGDSSSEPSTTTTESGSSTKNDGSSAEDRILKKHLKHLLLNKHHLKEAKKFVDKKMHQHEKRSVLKDTIRATHH